MVAKQDHTFTSAGSRPAFSAASFTIRTARAVVSSVKKVWSTTSSKQRPASASEFGPKAVSSIGMSTFTSAPSRSTG